MNKQNISDNDILNEILDVEKNISNYYSTFLNESSNDYLFENIFSMMEDSKDMAREIYNVMYRYNYYEIKEANDNLLKQEIIYLDNKLKELDLDN